MAVGLALLATAAWAQEDGKAATQRICTGCHGMDTVTATRYTKIGWQQVVDDMASRGAEASDQDIAEIVAYLTKTFGKINVNTASSAQLQGFLALGEKDAAAIVAYREAKGPIKNLDQLKAVPGVNAAKLQQQKDLIAFAQ